MSGFSTVGRWSGVLFSAILALVCSLFSAGHGLEAVSDPNVGDAAMTATFGFGAISLAGLAAWWSGAVSWGLSLWNATAGTTIPTEIAEAIAALQALAAAPNDWSVRKNAIVQSLEVAFAVGQLAIQDPTFDAILAQADQFVREWFDKNSPKSLTGTVKEGKLTLAEFASR